MKHYGCEPCIRIVAHSHGGNVALWLAEAEKEYKRGLLIDVLFMLGTPMQVETAPYIQSTLFKNMMLLCSHGDGIQGNDYFSTKNHKSYKHMRSLVDTTTFVEENPGYIRCDLRGIVNKNSRALTHVNMWMVGRGRVLLSDYLDVPFVCFVPFFVQAIRENPDMTVCLAHIDAHKDSCYTYVTRGYKNKAQAQQYGRSTNLCHGVRSVADALKTDWKPHDRSRNVVFNRKNIQALKSAVQNCYANTESACL